jgi:hypothetical protein
MKPDIDFDPMFEPKGRRRCGSICWLGAMLLVVMLGGVALRAGPIPAPRPGPRPLAKATIPGGAMVVQGPVQSAPAGAARPRDRFLILSREDIDPEMVVRAREDIDPEMVFNPETRRRGAIPISPAPADNPEFPRPQPTPAPGEPAPPR